MEEMIDGDNPPQEFEEYFHQKKDETKTYRQIVLEAIEKCRIEGSKQMTKGGEYLMENGMIISAPDQRQVYINCVETLFSLLSFTFDKEAEDNLKCLLNLYEDNPNGKKDEDIFGVLALQIKNLQQKYFDKYLIKEWWQPYVEQAKKEGRMVEGDRTTTAQFLTQQREDEKLRLYRKVFVELTLLFKRKNELSTKRTLGYK